MRGCVLRSASVRRVRSGAHRSALAACSMSKATVLRRIDGVIVVACCLTRRLDKQFVAGCVKHSVRVVRGKQ